MHSTQKLCAVALFALATQAASAEEHIIQAVIDHWQPQTTFAKPGDTIKFMNMTGHDTQSYDTMIPDGAKPWRSELGQTGFSVTLDKEGAYLFRCNPHVSMGMVGAVVVGDKSPPNLSKIEAEVANVKLAQNMVNRAVKKMKQELEQKGMK
jgi:pseudoazurin